LKRGEKKEAHTEKVGRRGGNGNCNVKMPVQIKSPGCWHSLIADPSGTKRTKEEKKQKKSKKNGVRKKRKNQVPLFVADPAAEVDWENLLEGGKKKQVKGS